MARRNVLEPPPHPIFTKKVHSEEPHLTIGKVAAIAGASPKAIRHYESLGLMPAPSRRGKYRIYSERDVFLVHVLKHAQTLGFRLGEMKGLVSAKVESRRFPLALANALFDRKRAELTREIAELRALRERLEKMRVAMNRNFGR
jgi:MerR family transcriptional regulator, copper efflux regulator